jgi:hypothetical protein
VIPGRLKVLRTHCPNLIAESQLYRYLSKERAILGENPIDSDNHALAALRYLIWKIDARFMAKLKRRAEDGPVPERDAGPEVEETQAALARADAAQTLATPGQRGAVVEGCETSKDVRERTHRLAQYYRLILHFGKASWISLARVSVTRV